MGRRKIAIEYINNDRQRSITYLKRREGLLKKAMELSLLCDVDIMLVMFDPKKIVQYSSRPASDFWDKYVEKHEHAKVNSFSNDDYEKLFPEKGGKENAGDDDGEDEGAEDATPKKGASKKRKESENAPASPVSKAAKPAEKAADKPSAAPSANSKATKVMSKAAPAPSANKKNQRR